MPSLPKANRKNLMFGRELIWHNFWWKLLALFLATVVWFTFHSGEKFEFQLRDTFGPIIGERDMEKHSLTCMVDAGDKRTFKVDPLIVDLSLSGEKELLKKLAGKDIKAFVNLTDITNDSGFIKIEVLVPRGIKVERVVPSEARYTINSP